MIALAKNDYSERHELIHDHLGMAKRLAGKIARRTPSVVRRDDLESAAFLGLTEAASRYDSTRGEPFVAYASKRVSGAVLDELRRNDILTRRGREGARRLQNAANAIQAQVGRAATNQEVADHLGMELSEVQEALGRLQPTLVALDEDRDLPKTSAFAPADEQVDLAKRKVAVLNALETMAERDLQILSMSFQDDLTLKEIGRTLAVSESRVSQLRSRALGRLRKAISASALRWSYDLEARGERREAEGGEATCSATTASNAQHLSRDVLATEVSGVTTNPWRPLCSDYNI